MKARSGPVSLGDIAKAVGVSRVAVCYALRNRPGVMSDNACNLMVALKSLRRLGYRRIGICLSQQVDSFSEHACRSTAAYLQATGTKSEQVPPLFYHWAGTFDDVREQVTAWLKRHRPEVIVCLDNRLAEWAEDAGFRVPRQMGVVHLALDDDVSDWAGIYSNKREIGATAAEWVINLLQSRRFGLPKVAMNMLVRGH